ncbi:MAG TPA: hypothetical protein VJ771_04940 [Candidatus Nitrosotalea sp.]|nr:hypothetical protein [Candidatus Nitrosotalea sp.]
MFSVITGIFLPTRMAFYAYVSPHWIGSLGLVSSLMILITFLAHKNKLGYFGTIFIEQMTKMMKGKSGKVVIAISLFFIAYLGSTLVWIERGNTIYSDEKQVVSNLMFHDSLTSDQIQNNVRVIQIHQNDVLFGFSRFDQVVSLTYAIMNDMMGGWLVNLDTILLIEQFEVLGLIFFYRQVCVRYFPIKSQTPF